MTRDPKQTEPPVEKAPVLVRGELVEEYVPMEYVPMAPTQAVYSMLRKGDAR